MQDFGRNCPLSRPQYRIKTASQSGAHKRGSTIPDETTRGCESPRLAATANRNSAERPQHPALRGKTDDNTGARNGVRWRWEI
jgi:hypothetical protein